MENKEVIPIKQNKPVHPIRISPTFAQKASDKLTKLIGSWTFIIAFVMFILIWIFLNAYALVNSWDVYPYILLNLTLSCIAAIQAPIILMSQNRANQKDRQRMEYDYQVDKRTEKEIKQIKIQLDRIENSLNKKNY
jgi:uncharacterized membrane protein